MASPVTLKQAALDALQDKFEEAEENYVPSTSPSVSSSNGSEEDNEVLLRNIQAGGRKNGERKNHPVA